MKNEIDELMTKSGVDGLWITGRLSDNAAARYFVGKAHLTEIDIIKASGKTAALYHGPMERQEAASTGLQVRTRSNDDWQRYLAESDGELHSAKARRLADEFRQAGLEAGQVAVYGKVEPGAFLAIQRALAEQLPRMELLAAGQTTDILATARRTKSPDELAAIEAVGRQTIEVVQLVQEYLTAQSVQNGHLTTSAGEALTVGEVKSQIHLWLAERQLEAPHGIIFAPGSQAGYPHSEGAADSPIPVGESLLFDIFPRQIGGGYFYDFTRTWCLGEPREEVRQAHRAVLSVYEQMAAAMRVGVNTQDLQIDADRAFEALGFPTRLGTPGTTDGFFHGLAHGVGLEIHEAPWFDETGTRTSDLEANMVLTVEPGLYYPEQGFGVRIEDTLLIEPSGSARILVPYPTDLVLPIRSDQSIRESM